MRALMASSQPAEHRDSRLAPLGRAGRRYLAWALLAVSALSIFLMGQVEAGVTHSGTGNSANGDVRTITLQAGIHDTFLDAYNPGTSQGRDYPDALKLRRGAYHTLLSFDISDLDLPEGAEVLSATLGLYACWADREPPLPLLVEVYGVLRPWVDVQATWNEAQSGQAWAGPGCAGAGTDREVYPVTSQTIAGINRWHNLDVTSLVRDWVEVARDNQGLLLAASPSSALVTYNFRSGDWREEGERPRLVVTYTFGASVETPTVTATSLPTVAATPSDTATSQPTALTETPTATVAVVASASPSSIASITPTLSPSPTPTLAEPSMPWRTPVPNSLYPYPEQRIGFVAFSTWGRDVQGLHAGLAKLEDRGPYSWERSLGLDFVTVFDVYYQVYDYPTREEYQARIRQMVSANPGYTWFIGNEPEALCRGNRPAREYARIYHDMYNLIKGVDRNAIVGIGGVVVPSQFRLQWLDQTLSDYRMLYGEPMPVDVWSVHNLLLSECPGACGCFPDKLPVCSTCCSGGYMPVGQEGACGVRIYRSQQDQANVQMFKDLIWDMRRWMATRDEARGKPLLLTEMGVFANYLAEGSRAIFPHEMINQFMADAFDFLLTASDAQIGCTSDGGRLVQRWTWYGLDHNFCYCDKDLNGSLTTHGQLNDFGVSFGNYTAQFLPTLPITLFVEKGWSGYTKDADTTIVAPSGGNASIDFIKIQADGSRKALLQFDLPAIPSSVEVATATLSLRSKSHSGIGSMAIDCYGVRRPWDVGAATWLSATQGTSWQQPGCAGMQDREQLPVSTVTATTDGMIYTWDVTQLARQWAADPASNHGVLLQASSDSGGGYWYFVSSNQVEDTRAGAEWTYRARPKLELTLRLRETAVTPTPSATASPSPSATFLATATATSTPTGPATPTTTATGTRAPTPSVTITPTPTQFPGCTTWDHVWKDECDDAAMPRWYSDKVQGVAEVESSILHLSAPGSGSDRFPLLWTRPAFPVQDCVLELRFRFGTPTERGTTIGIGTRLYDSRRFQEGDAPPVGMDDVLSIHQSSEALNISLLGQVTWADTSPDTAWHVVRVEQHGLEHALYFDGRLKGIASAQSGTLRSIFLGSPLVTRDPGPWTPLDVDYVRIGVCRCWDVDTGCP